MYEPSFLKRLRTLGPQSLILSYDTLMGIIAFFATYIYTEGSIAVADASGILSSFASVSATLFAIVLTGLTIVTSFTDRYFLYTWQEVGEFENLVTTFQYNLVLPIVVLLFTLALQVRYNSLAMLILIALFVYMLFALMDLVELISRYALQRGEFVKQQVETEIKRNEGEVEEGSERLSDEELLRIRRQLAELHDQKERE